MSADLAFAASWAAALTWYNNIGGRQPWHRRWYPVVNLGATTVALAAATASGLTTGELGLGRKRLRDGLRLGGRLAAPVAGGLGVAVLLPATRPVLRDRRNTSLGGRELAYQVLFRIPAGTVVWEEIAFRGVLQAALRRAMPGPAAIAVTSVTFGIWHVRPTAQALRANRLTGSGRDHVLATAAGVAATGAAGVLLSWLRARSGSLAAPVTLHLAANCGGLLASWLALKALPLPGTHSPGNPRCTES